MQKPITFPMVMKSAAISTLALTVIFALLYRFFPADWILPVAISAGTTCYHFTMRLLVGFLVPPFVKKPMQRRWFQQKHFETKLYHALKVKHWKDHMPTYDPASFSLRENSLEQVIRDFTGVEEFTITSTNRGDAKSYKYIYPQFQKDVLLPRDYVDYYYKDNAYTSHFYSEEERKKFMEKWEKHIV